MISFLQPVVGYAALIAIAWILSARRAAIPWRTVLGGIGLQILLAVLIHKVPLAQSVILVLNSAMVALEEATRAGTTLVFGYLGGGPAPFPAGGVGSGFVLAFQALPIVLVISALSALLFHWRILPAIVNGFSWLLERTLGVGGAVGLSTAANVFVGMVEAPLLIKPYLDRVSRGELFIVMTAGMAGVAGTVMALYAGILGAAVPGALGHILAASFMSAPAAVFFSVLMVPPEGDPTGKGVKLASIDDSTMAAITRGTTEGLGLLLNIVARLIVLVALVACRLVRALWSAERWRHCPVGALRGCCSDQMGGKRCRSGRGARQGVRANHEPVPRQQRRRLGPGSDRWQECARCAQIARSLHHDGRHRLADLSTRPFVRPFDGGIFRVSQHVFEFAKRIANENDLC